MSIMRGNPEKGKDYFFGELGFGIVVVRDVPAKVCSQCGADWIEDQVAEQLENIVSEARRKHHLVEVTSLSPELSQAV